MFINGDISNKASIKDIVGDVIKTYGKIDILVNNAHVSKQAPLVQSIHTPIRSLPLRLWRKPDARSDLPSRRIRIRSAAGAA